TMINYCTINLENLMIFGRKEKPSTATNDSRNAIITPDDLNSRDGRAATYATMHPTPLPPGYAPYQPRVVQKGDDEPKDLTFDDQAGYQDNDAQLLRLARGEEKLDG